MKRLPVLSDKEFLIADMMADSVIPLYGLDMIRKSKGKLKSGTVYVTLSRMENKGYVSSKVENHRIKKKGQPRRFYKLATAGQKAHHLTKKLIKGNSR